MLHATAAAAHRRITLICFAKLVSNYFDFKKCPDVKLELTLGPGADKGALRKHTD